MVSCNTAAFLCSMVASAAIAMLLGTPALHAWYDAQFANTAASTPAVNVVAPPRPAPLAQFLGTNDVDGALIAAKAFAKHYSSPEYVASLTYLLEHEWLTHPQGIYNLLQHSYMIPGDHRYASLQRGLTDKSDFQYRLAAAIGIQFTPKTHLERAPLAEQSFRRILLKYAAEYQTDDFLAARAFLAVKDRLAHPRDTRFVLALLQNPVVWRNAIAWMLNRVSTTAVPLTAERLRSMLTEAIAADKANGSVAAVDEDPTAAPWTFAWSDRLQSIDVDAVLAQAGVALEEHWSKQARKGEHSKLAQYQEIDIPAYAHLQMGFTDEQGKAAPSIDTAAKRPVPVEIPATILHATLEASEEIP